MYSFSVVISKDWYCCLRAASGIDYSFYCSPQRWWLHLAARHFISGLGLHLQKSNLTLLKRLKTWHMKEASSDGALHSLPSARGRSWALPLPRPGAGLWRRAASWYPSGGSKCHHDVSQKSIFLSFFNILKQLWVSHISQHLTSVKVHSNASTRFIKDS